LGDALQPSGRSREVLTLLGHVDLPGLVPQRGDEFPQMFAERIGHDAPLADATVALRLFGQPGRHALEEVGCPVATLPDLFLSGGQFVMHQQSTIGPIVVQFSERVLDLTVGDIQTQVVAGHGLDGVGFIKHDDVKFRQNTDVLAF